MTEVGYRRNVTFRHFHRGPSVHNEDLVKEGFVFSSDDRGCLFDPRFEASEAGVVYRDTRSHGVGL